MGRVLRAVEVTQGKTRHHQRRVGEARGAAWRLAAQRRVHKAADRLEIPRRPPQVEMDRLRHLAQGLHVALRQGGEQPVGDGKHVGGRRRRVPGHVARRHQVIHQIVFRRPEMVGGAGCGVEGEDRGRAVGEELLAHRHVGGQQRAVAPGDVVAGAGGLAQAPEMTAVQPAHFVAQRLDAKRWDGVTALQDTLRGRRPAWCCGGLRPVTDSGMMAPAAGGDKARTYRVAATTSRARRNFLPLSRSIFCATPVAGLA